MGFDVNEERDTRGEVTNMKVMITSNKLEIGRHNDGLAPLCKLDGKRGLSDIDLRGMTKLCKYFDSSHTHIHAHTKAHCGWGHLALIVA